MVSRGYISEPDSQTPFLLFQCSVLQLPLRLARFLKGRPLTHVESMFPFEWLMSSLDSLHLPISNLYMMEQASAAMSASVGFVTCEHALRAEGCLRRAVKLAFDKDDPRGSWAAAP